MRSNNMPLPDLFERQRRYVVPLFQRPYVWTEEEQWVPLWHDILGRAEAVLERDKDRSRAGRIDNHFLGAVVLNQISVFGRQVSSVEVIDGQQRLTTLQLLLAAFRDLVRETDERQLGDELGRLTVNDGVRASEEEQYKVWPTNADRGDFSAAMSSGGVDAIVERYPETKRQRARKPDPRPRLIEAYLFFARSVREFCCDSSERAEADQNDRSAAQGLRAVFLPERAHALFEALRRHIQLVVIELEAEDDPQTIFETLNARGVPLLPSDLIRNFVFLRATRQGKDAAELYATWWAEYDERLAEPEAGDDQRFWKQTERQGRLTRTRLDLFINHYLTYRTGLDLEIGHLFKSFRAWWEQAPARAVEAELETLRAHSDAFARVLVPAGRRRIDVFANRLRAIDTSTVYPLLLLLMVGSMEKLSEADFDGTEFVNARETAVLGIL